MQQVADIASVPSIDQLNIKIRKSLKGHNAKVVCLDWCSDKRHLVSSAQDGKLIVWVSAQYSCCLVVRALNIFLLKVLNIKVLNSTFTLFITVMMSTLNNSTLLLL